MRAQVLSLLLVSLGLAGGCATRSPVAVETARTPATARPGSPEALPPWMLPMVRSQMASLWDRVTELRWSAASLEFDRTADLARGVAKEAHSGRPVDQPPEALLPVRFLRLQDELRQRAQHLVLAATSHNSRGVSVAYGALVDTCARCHAHYQVARSLTMPTLAQR